jgi:hypothetical protein
VQGPAQKIFATNGVTKIKMKFHEVLKAMDEERLLTFRRDCWHEGQSILHKSEAKYEPQLFKMLFSKLGCQRMMTLCEHIGLHRKNEDRHMFWVPTNEDIFADDWKGFHHHTDEEGNVTETEWHHK